ncbi:GntT/GntP/DsdX family permease [Sphingomonas nostoxanthinifaciens]|uniref:GntT/GntP/DsdX family permease n=1 Tax=Sphingomonas nostoxanthinifaciens TaxID=2872652 RepID=UPI001CC1D9D4|nr:gluconate:H+ symporter [Sphingomonas nostoxanthinifaciens]UAK25360.1 GntP family permease [Sphingomonas nostoxanthinifaciens]
MTPADIKLILAALIGIGLSIVLIVRGRLHPFVSLLCGAFVVGLLAGLPMAETAQAVQKGAGDVLGGTGLVVALGLSLGAMLQLSGGAASLAAAGLRLSGPKGAPWASMAVALLVGLPLFFETGLVLLLPIVAAAATGIRDRSPTEARLRLMLPALAGLSVVHALVPPHPGPLLAVDALHANLGLTIVYGVIIGIPTAIIAGPIFAMFASRWVKVSTPVIDMDRPLVTAPSNARTLAAILLPVVLIAAGQIHAVLPPSIAPRIAFLGIASNPILALLIANLAALPLLFGWRMREADVQGPIWLEAMKAAGAIILAIGAGGSLKQVLVTAGLAEFLARVASEGHVPAVLMAWLIAVCVRLATGSATVATITTAGIMPAVVAATGARPELVVLATGAGSLFFSHVNDPGFWLVRSYLGTSTPDTFRTWSILETIVAVVGLLFVLLASAIL